MATVVTPLITPNQVHVVATGYVKGDLGSYAGLTVSSNGQDGPQISTTFHSTGAVSGFFIDLQMVQMHTLYSRRAFGQAISAGSHVAPKGGVQEGGVTWDQSVFDYIADFFAANG